MNRYDDLYNLLHFLDQQNREEFYNKLKDAVEKGKENYKFQEEIDSLMADLELFSIDIGCEKNDEQ